MPRFLALVLMGLVIGPPAYTLIRGDAHQSAAKPYERYVVQARDIQTGDVMVRVFLSKDGSFVVSPVPLPGRYVLELVTPKNQIVCTNGPVTVTGETFLSFACSR